VPPDIKLEFKLGMRRTYGASMLQQHFTYLLKNPALHPSVREALTRETELRSVKSGETLQHGKLKTLKYFEDRGNWAHLANDRRFWKQEVVKKAKFHYNYHYPEPITEKPPPEKCKYDVWIVEKKPVPEITPSPPCETQKKRKNQEKKKKNQPPRTHAAVCSLHSLT